MTYRYQFNDIGIWGAALFVLGPITLAVGYWLLLTTPAYENTTSYVAIMAVGGLASLASIPMLLIGRDMVPLNQQKATVSTGPASSLRGDL